MHTSYSPIYKTTLIAMVMIFITLACGLDLQSSSQPPEPEDPAAEESRSSEEESVVQEEAALLEEAIEQEIEEELELAFEVLAEGFFLFSQALATNDSTKMDQAFVLLGDYIAGDEISFIRQHIISNFTDLVFFANDPLGDVYTCNGHQSTQDPFAFVDTRFVFGGILPNGNIGISSLSAFDAEAIGTNLESYVIENGMHHLMRIPIFEPDATGLEEMAQWHYEPTDETFSINLKNVVFSDGERFLTFQGVANGEWVSTPTPLQSIFDNGIWLMQFDPSPLSDDTLLYFTSNSLDTNNPDDPDFECQYDDSLLNDTGGITLKISDFR